MRHLPLLLVAVSLGFLPAWLYLRLSQGLGWLGASFAFTSSASSCGHSTSTSGTCRRMSITSSVGLLNGNFKRYEPSAVKCDSCCGCQRSLETH